VSDTLRATEASPATKSATTLTTRVAEATPRPVIDLSVAIRVRERHVQQHGLLHYTITAANLSNVPATGVRVTGSLDEPVTLVSVLAGQARSTTDAGALVHACRSALPLVCTLGTLAPHEVVSIHLEIRPLVAASLLAHVSIRANEPETTLQNNQSRVVLLVLSQRAAVTVRKTALERQVRAGGTVRYTIAVRLAGAATALGVRVCDRLPSDQAFATVDGASFSNGEACWVIPRLTPGTVHHFNISATVDDSSTTHHSTNTVIVTGANIDPKSASANVLVTGKPGRPGGATG
jgi:uncharacterized repeat protein (TIGR01451 family)